MSKYENAIQVKKRNESLIKDFENQIYVKGHRDKTGLNWQFMRYESTSNEWNPILLAVGLNHGYYGSSSCGDDNSEDAGRELAKTLSELKQIIIETTINRLKKEIRDSAEKASDEAKEIIEIAKSNDA